MERKTLKKIKRSHLLPALAILAFYSLFMVVSACDSSTSPKTGTLTGRVELVNDTGNPELDPADFSGVQVVIYKLAELNPSVVNVYNRYPSLGFPISQLTEFDHISAPPLYSTITSPDGYFILDGIPRGDYNVVAEKEGWGFSYVLDCEVSDNTGNSTLSITLYPETIMASVIMDDFDFQADHIYRFNADCVTTQESSVTIERGTKLLMDDGVCFDIYGYASVIGNESDFVRITSSGPQVRLNRISIQPSAQVSGNVLQGIIVLRSTQGLQISRSDIEIRCMRGADSISAISLSSASGVSITNVIITGCDGVDTGSIQLYGSPNYSLVNSILASNTQAIKSRVSANGTIENVTFMDNSEYDVNNNDQCEGLIIKWCDFVGSNTALWNTYHSAANISFCTFEGTDGIVNDNGRYSMVQVNNCNFDCTEYAVKTRVYYYGNTEEVHIDASMNYWGTTIESEIQQLVWDRFDEPTGINNYEALLGVIDYQPFLTRAVSNAGVQNN
ncbi:MAG: carboxypeptidase-like regulatory domain-containing protein [Proteiniphilum sp.]|nr:carboxypeptidase-like regulatory domain-containing protein [Proteiniphilum sp.]